MTHSSRSGSDNEGLDAELRARLRAADPAADLPPADSDDVDHLLGRVLHSDLRETGTRRRSPLTWLVAAAAIVVIAVGVVWWVRDDSSETGVVATPQPDTTTPTVLTTTLTAASAVGRCIEPSAQLLARKPVAFAGRVLGIADGVVTIRPATVYAGRVGKEVTIRGGVASDTGAVEGTPRFRAGQDYLVAADGGRVVGCGLSGPATPQLRSLYAQAFPK
jgi:hypothetical protein